MGQTPVTGGVNMMTSLCRTVTVPGADIGEGVCPHKGKKKKKGEANYNGYLHNHENEFLKEIIRLLCLQSMDMILVRGRTKSRKVLRTATSPRFRATSAPGNPTFLERFP